jgi:hypothetical protein
MSNIMPVNMPVSNFNEDDFRNLSSASYLPRIQLMNSTSDLVKLDKARQGNFVIVRSKEDFTELTKEVCMFAVAWRPKAIDMSVPGVVTQSYDPRTPLFKQIASRSEVPNSRCAYGAEFLVWVDSEKEFATLHMGSKTARRVASDIMAHLKAQTPFILKSTLIKTSSNSWFGYVVTSCSQTVSITTPEEEFTDMVHKFLNPPVEELVEEVRER